MAIITWLLKCMQSYSCVHLSGYNHLTKKYDDDNLESVSKIKYLGLMISPNGCFNQTQITVAEQANKATFALHKRLNDLININPYEMSVGFPQSPQRRKSAS